MKLLKKIQSKEKNRRWILKKKLFCIVIKSDPTKQH